MTADELFCMPEEAGGSYELVRGELLHVSPSAPMPGVVSANVLTVVNNWVLQRALGLCGTADSGYLLRRDPDTVRAPDAWLVRAERIPPDGIPARGFWPDLAVEVLSPTDRYRAVMLKARDYSEAGTTLLWVIDSIGRVAAVFRPNAAPQLLEEGDSLDGEDVMLGFAVLLGSLPPVTRS